MQMLWGCEECVALSSRNEEYDCLCRRKLFIIS